MQNSKIRVFIVSLPGISQRMLENVFCSRDAVNLVGTAEGGLSALKEIKDLKPQVIVIDTNLPHTEAAELTHAIKASDFNPITLILVETSQQIEQANKIGPDYVLLSYDLSCRLNNVLKEIGSKLNIKNQKN